MAKSVISLARLAFCVALPERIMSRSVSIGLPSTLIASAGESGKTLHYAVEGAIVGGKSFGYGLSVKCG